MTDQAGTWASPQHAVRVLADEEYRLASALAANLGIPRTYAQHIRHVAGEQHLPAASVQDLGEWRVREIIDLLQEGLGERGVIAVLNAMARHGVRPRKESAR